MRLPVAAGLGLVGLLLTESALQAQDHSAHEREPPSGYAQFPTSCNAELQDELDRAVALLHSFAPDQARSVFQGVAERDPACGIAWWGVAMSEYHLLAEQPGAETLKVGRQSAARALEISASTDRERRYIAALDAVFLVEESAPGQARPDAYLREMAQLHLAFPEDDHAAIFYALALFAAASPADRSFSQQRLAANILNERMATVSKYPHIVHSMIHSLDEPQLAELALPAAREFAARAPAAAHPLHMPSHTFTRLGLWSESIASNLASEAAAHRRLRGIGAIAASSDALHALDYLEYAYLQTCNGSEAQRIVRQVQAVEKVEHSIYSVGYALAAIPARWALERRRWQDAASLEVPRAHLPWERFPYALAIIYFARSLGAASVGDLEKARAALAELEKIQIDLVRRPPSRDPYDWPGNVEAMRLAAKGWLVYREGRGAEALALLRAAADLEDGTGRHSVTPGAVLPARELLADLLLELKRPADALIEYEAELKSAPGRLRALGGAAQAAMAASAPEKARALSRQILAQCDSAGDWPEVAMARALLAVEATGPSP